MSNILIVIGTTAVGGGAEKVAANLGNYLTDQGHAPHLLTFYEADLKNPYHGIYHSFAEHLNRSRFSKVWGIPWRIYKIARYIKQHRITTAVAFLEEANFYTLLVKKIFCPQLRVVVSVRNNVHARGRLFTRLATWLYPSAYRVVSVTKSIEHTLKTEFGLTNTVTIYNPVDVDLVAEKVSTSLPEAYHFLTERSPLFVSIGRLTAQKAQWALLRAFRSVVDKEPQATLALIGTGDLVEPLRQLAADLVLTDNVYFLGRQENVYPFLEAADAFVFSSRWEGMPNAMLEALAVGLPIISTDCVSGPREIIAPELSVTEAISYPYLNDLGTLVKVPDGTKRFVTLKTTPLTSAEAELAATMLTQCSSSSRYRTDTPRYHSLRPLPAPATATALTRFLPATVFTAWERLLVPVSSDQEQTEC